MRSPTKDGNSFSSMRNALRLLNLFSIEQPELSLSEISEKLHTALSTAHRLANTLLREGFLVKDSRTKYYRLGASTLAMSNIVLSQIELARHANIVLEQLVKETGETAHVSILKETKVVYLHQVDSQHPVHLLSHAGRHNPAYCTSSGQAILAYQSPAIIDKVASSELLPFTKYTITNPETLKLRLKHIRDHEIAISKEELHAGVISIAAPVRNKLNEVIASVSIAGPISRIHDKNIDILSKQLKKAVVDLENRCWKK